MSIIEILDRLCDEGNLRLWEPKHDADQSIYRRLYVAPSVYEWLHPRPPILPATLQFTTDVRFYLKTFVIGADFDLDDKLKNLDTNGRKPIDRGLWAIRVKRAPQVRIFGGFACANVFVASHHEFRSAIGPADWEAQKQRTMAFWNTLSVDALDQAGQSCKTQVA